MIKPLIIDIQSGNILSLKNILSNLNTEVTVGNKEEEIEKSTHILLPGVGTYSNVIKNTNKFLNIPLLKNQIILKKKPILGICVGMQILSDFGKENGTHNGLSMINGSVEKIVTEQILPHVGWNSINILAEDKIFEGIPNGTDFYFTHSFYFNLLNKNNELAVTSYDIDFPSIIKKNNIYGVQFHPEKSQGAGIRLIKNFLNL